MSLFRFAAIGIDHDHIFGQIDCLIEAGCTFASYHAGDNPVSRLIGERYPQAVRVDDPRRIYEDGGVALIISAAVPGDRAAIGLAAMRHGKDFMSDKPGLTTMAQLEEARRVQAETGRIYSILYSEHYGQRATVHACDLARAGAIGKVINVIGMGPHRLRKPQRPAWFFDKARYGGILTDIGSHQAEQFLFLSGAPKAEVLSARVANVANADTPGLQDLGEVHFATPDTTGFVRVDWFTPDGLPTWGDGRLFITGTEGTIELRKYLDVAGRPGTDHLFLTDAKGVRHIDCSQTPLPYGRQLAADVLNRTETAMTQAHCFAAMELILTAQAMADAAAERRA